MHGYLLLIYCCSLAPRISWGYEKEKCWPLCLQYMKLTLYVSLSVVSICMSYVMHIHFARSVIFSFFIFCGCDFFPPISTTNLLLLYLKSFILLFTLTQMSVHTDCTWLWYFLLHWPSLQKLLRVFSTATWNLFLLCGISFFFFPPLFSPRPPCGLFFLLSLSFFAFVPTVLYLSLSFSHPSPILSHLPSLQ